MNIYLKEKNIQGEKAMQIQAIIQEIVCIIDEDGSDRFDFTKVGCIFPVIVISILYHSEPMTIRNVPHFS